MPTRKLKERIAEQYKIKPGSSWHFEHPKFGEIKLEELDSLNLAAAMAEAGVALVPKKK